MTEHVIVIVVVIIVVVGVVVAGETLRRGRGDKVRARISPIR